MYSPRWPDVCIDMTDFTLYAIGPASLQPAVGIAIAGSRAGEVGLVDLSISYRRQTLKNGSQSELDSSIRSAESALKQLRTRARRRWGLKYASSDFDLVARSLAASLGPAPHAVIITPVVGLSVVEQVAHWRRLGTQVLVEVTSVREADDALEMGPDGLVAKGNEAGGWVGEESSFILLQRLLSRTAQPVIAHGGIGRHTIAAARALGVAGAILDAQLLLTRESALTPQARKAVARMDGSETTCLTGPGGRQYRCWIPPGRGLERQLVLEASQASTDERESWAQELQDRTGWNVEGGELLPVGQDAAFAAPLAGDFVTAGRALQGLRAAAEEHLLAAATRSPLAQGSPLAVSHGTRYPIVQGPMTRVSDQAVFAKAVAETGALPFLALALMPATDVAHLLSRTATVLGQRPWGVGILGFVPEQLRLEQLEVIRRQRPPYALIAGGRPDQAAELEQVGVRTYLHVPSPELLRLFAEAGVRRFVLEGRECGGHVGPRSSFVLWDGAIDALSDALAPEQLHDCHVLFAGGVHDSASATAVAALAGTLAEAGVKVGVEMGTAYLFTTEAVASGAITPVFQAEATACDQTVLLESGPGYSTRCARTSVVDAFAAERGRLLEADVPPEDILDDLEHFNIGRLRIAAKGMAHGSNGEPDPVHPEVQRSEGLFMMGQVAALRERVVTLAELHRQVSEVSTVPEPRLGVSPEPADRTVSPIDIAIVGMSCLLPGASSVDEFWANILAGVDAVTEVPADRWDPDRYFDPDPNVRDKIYSRWGGFLRPIRFEPLSFGMPPNSLPYIESMQLLALHTVRAALADAGYPEGRGLPRDTTSVLLGAGGGVADLGQQYAVRAALPALLGEVPEDVLGRLPEWSEDSFPGVLLNVTAGRVANRFDLGGLNATVDAACASSLAALDWGARELAEGTSDAVLVGGVETVQNSFGYLAFAKTHALSPSGRCRPFDDAADGIAISEGVAVAVLKRLADAERDGDRVYAVLKGVGGSSDGRARGLTAPRPEGQARALRRAYRQAGFSSATVQLVEAHGTGTVAGDQAEVETLRTVFGAAGATRQHCAIGSVKSMIGHTKCTAGMAGLIKAALALRYEILPPTLGVSVPNRFADFPSSPFYVNSEARPWFEPADHPRRAAVSAFGFGGTNFHAVLEEYVDQPAAPTRRWPGELFLFSGEASALRAELKSLADGLADSPEADLSQLAAAVGRGVTLMPSTGRLAVVASSMDDLGRKLEQAANALDNPEFSMPGVWWREMPADGQVAFLYPGQGSQRPGMLQTLALHFKELRKAFEDANAELAGRLSQPLVDLVFPVPTFDPTERQEAIARLKSTRAAQPALGAAAVGLTRLLDHLGIRPDLVAGHSYGEYPALWAAGALDETTLYRLSAERGRAIAEAAGPDAGSMLAVIAGTDEVSRLTREVEGVWLSNQNAPQQTVVSGTRAGLTALVAACEAEGLTYHELDVAAGFHSPLIAAARDRFADVLSGTEIRPPDRPVFANATAQRYPEDPGAVAELLADHLVTPVRFAEEVEALHDAGARVFLEVGPGSALTGLVGQILIERPHVAVAIDTGNDGLVGLLGALGQLWTAGVPIEMARLEEDRVTAASTSEVLAAGRPRTSGTTWLVDGGGARPLNAPTAPVRPAADSGQRLAAEAERADGPMPRPQTEELTATAAVSVPVGPPIDTPEDGLADAVVTSYQRLMEQFLVSQRDIMLAYLRGPVPQVDVAPGVEPVQAGTSMEPPPTVEVLETSAAPDAASPEPAGQAGDDVLSVLRALIAERTGYPADLISDDLDLEADLGIDSIKRVEVIGALARTRASDERRRITEATKQLRKVRTLSALGAALRESLLSDGGEVAAVQPSADVRIAAPTNGAERATTPRFVLSYADAPLAAPASVPRPGRYLITDDGGGVAEALAAELAGQGGQAEIVTFSRDTIASDVDQVRRGSGSLTGCFHLHPLRKREQLDEAEQVLAEVTDLITLGQTIEADLTELPERRSLVVGTSGLGATTPLVASALAGLGITLAAEWTAQVRVVDLDSADGPVSAAQQLLVEANLAGPAEIQRRNGRRQMTSIRREELDRRRSPFDLGPDSVVLLTGGGRGITAQLAEGLAASGATLILAGRSPKPASPHPAGIEAFTSRTELRSALAELAREREEPVTAAAIERQATEIERGREIAATMARLRAAGAHAQYLQLDVGDAAAVDALLHDLYAEHGSIDALIHGAGVLEDQLVVDKTPDSVGRVVSPKVAGALNLVRCLRPDSLRLMVLMTSVAGWFGNPGQADYAAANRALDALALRLDADWPGRVVSISWGPWDGTGMVTPEVRAQFLRRGITPVEPTAGIQAFLDEIRYGRKGEAQVLIGNGPWAGQSRPDRGEWPEPDANGHGNGRGTGVSFLTPGRTAP